MLALSLSDRMRLAGRADQEIARALRGEAGALPPAGRTEALGMLISEVFPTVADAWNGLLAQRGIAVQLFGAFTFSAPEVEFADRTGADRRCELGDVLVIVDDLARQPTDRRAVLIHARMLSPPGASQDPIGAAARELFATWPAFCFLPPTRTHSPRTLWDLGVPASGEDCGLFAGIDLGAGSVNLQHPIPELASQPVTLGRLLVAMAVGEAGRKAIRAGSDAWSRTVDSLLHATIDATTAGLRKGAAELRTIARHSGDGGTGFVVFDTARDISPDAVEAQSRANGPLPVIHLVFKRAAKPKDPGETKSSRNRAGPTRGWTRPPRSPSSGVRRRRDHPPGRSDV